MFNEKRGSMLHGILLIALFSCASFYIAETKVISELSLSPMIIGILLGMVYANSLRNHLPETWVPGIQFCAKKLLRLGIILYGFRLTFQDILLVGAPGIIVDVLIVVITIIGGVYLGKLMKMDEDISLLTSIGSGICGAAAILGAESTIQTKPYKTAVAVATVVIFGTIAMFIYPVLYNKGVVSATPEEMGIYTGATVHEVAHTVGAGNSMGQDISNTAIIVKMIRVMMLVPVLLLLSWWAARKAASNKSGDKAAAKKKVSIPWFALGFLLVIVINSVIHFPIPAITAVNNIDTFLLTMAMVALGCETSFDKFKKAGAKPFILAFILFAWLMVGGYYITKIITPMFM